MFVNNVFNHLFKKKNYEKRKKELIMRSLTFRSRILRVRPRRGLANLFYERGI